jgi:hypothetical protein
VDKDDKVTISLTNSEDKKTVTMVISSPVAISYKELLEHLDFCYHELKRALEQRSSSSCEN